MNHLSPKQRKFAEAYLKTGNATQAVLDAGYNTSRKLARSHGAKLTKNQRVWALIESSADQAQRNMLKLANSAKNESVRLGANKDILDRSGFMPVTRTQTTTVNISIDNQRFEDILNQYKSRQSNKIIQNTEESDNP